MFASNTGPDARPGVLENFLRGNGLKDLEARVGIEPTLRFQWFPVQKTQQKRHFQTSLTFLRVSRNVSSVMASIHRRPASAYWHAAWRGEGGRLFLRSTKQTERAKAMTVALEFERAAKQAITGDLTEQQARKVLNDILEKTSDGDTLRSPAVAAYLAEWLAGKDGRATGATLEKYGKTVSSFLAHLGDRAARPLTALTPRQIDAFLASRTKEGCSPSTVNLDGKILRAALNKAHRQGLIPNNPAAAVELPERACVERGTFTPAEIGMLLAAGEGEWQTLILAAYYTGQRLTDCTRMAWADVDLSRRVWTLRQGKTGQALVVPLHEELLAHLEGLAGSDAPEAYVMPHMATLGPGGRHGLSEGFKRIARKAGVDIMAVQGGGKRKVARRTFHALRHSFTSALLNAGVAPELRMKLTGHKSAEVHRGYSHAEVETLRSAVAKLPRVGGAA